MAQALQKIWLEPEEQHEPVVPQPRSPRRRRTAATGWVHIALTTLAVSCVVGALTVFVSTYARIAESEMNCQALKQQYAQLNREHIELNLELERLATQPRLTQVAQEQGLEMPDPQRVHYLQGTADYPRAYQTPAEPAAQSGWAQRSGEQFRAALDTAWQVLGGDTRTAYAQD